MNKQLRKFNPPSMALIEEDAQHLSNFNGQPALAQQLFEEEGYDDEEYDGFDDDDLSFDGRSRSFRDQHKGSRMLSVTIDNSANNTDVTVGLFSSFKALFAAAGEGATTSIEGTNINIRSNGITKLVELQRYVYNNPTRAVGLRIVFSRPEQAGKTITIAYQDPFSSVKETILQPESYRTERNQQDKIITIPEPFTLGNQTDLKIQVAAQEKVNIFVMFGAIYNTAKSLSKKNDRAAMTLAPAAAMLKQ